jgi:hypothetical protein
MTAPLANEFELKELYRIVAFLEKQLSERNGELKRANNDIMALKAQCELANTEVQVFVTNTRRCKIQLFGQRLMNCDEIEID